jgi:DNA-binding protein H-NS
MDFSTLSLEELACAEKALKAEIRKRRDVELGNLYHEMTKIARHLNVSLRGLGDIGLKEGMERLPVLYINPDNPAQRWRGNGKKPKWLREWLKSGKSLDMVCL